jgi:ABC-type transporter Mla MlaB component
MEAIQNIRETNSGYEIIWKGYLTVPYVNDWLTWTKLWKFKPGSILKLDLTNIERIDTAGIQFLIFLKTYSLNHNYILKLMNHSLPVLKSMDILGLVSYFGDKVKVKKEFAGEVLFHYGTKKQA